MFSPGLLSGRNKIPLKGSIICGDGSPYGMSGHEYSPGLLGSTSGISGYALPDARFAVVNVPVASALPQVMRKKCGVET